MKIFSESFKKWSKILSQYQKKGNPFEECMFLDFKDSSIYFGFDMIRGKLNFSFETEPGEEIPEGFFISTDKFLNVITQYDSLDFDGKCFINGKDRFEFSTLPNDDRVEFSLFDSSDKPFVDVPKDVLKEIDIAKKFVDPKDDDDNLQSVFVKNGRVYGTTSVSPIYEAKVDFKEELILGKDVVDLLSAINIISEGCKISQNTKTAEIKSFDEELHMIVPNRFISQVLDTISPKFVERYNHSTKIEFDKETFSNSFNLISVYFGEQNNNARTAFIITDKDVTLCVKTDMSLIEKHVLYKSVSPELIGTTYHFPGLKIKKILDTLKGETLTIRLPVTESESVIDLFTGENQHAITVRFPN